MKEVLGDELENFLEALSRPAVRSFRVNTLKARDGKVSFTPNIALDKIPYAPSAYTVLSCGEGLGSTPEHHSGMIYFQDAGAMAPVCALPDLPDGARVLDMCASPGGKSGQLASLLSDGGSLLSNEMVPKRARVLVSNLERLGVTNAAVTSLDSARLAEAYPEFFDAVVIDAPCSGEGMFRKGDEAIECWSIENIDACARRQREILKNGAATVARGGYLLYSTCTYAPEENELQVAAFLDTHPDFSLVRCENKALLDATQAGIHLKDTDYDLTLCRRNYPHRSNGEGQFFALMKRSGERGEVSVRDNTAALTKQEEAAVLSFLKEHLTEIPRGRLVKQQSVISLVMHSIPLPKNGVFMPGVAIGELRSGRLVPHHQFFSALGHLFRTKHELGSYEEARRYMHGEELTARGDTSGYLAVTWQGCAIGGGKASGGVIKNHYPKGLRI